MNKILGILIGLLLCNYTKADYEVAYFMYKDSLNHCHSATLCRASEDAKELSLFLDGEPVYYFPETNLDTSILYTIVGKYGLRMSGSNVSITITYPGDMSAPRNMYRVESSSPYNKDILSVLLVSYRIGHDWQSTEADKNKFVCGSHQPAFSMMTGRWILYDNEPTVVWVDKIREEIDYKSDGTRILIYYGLRCPFGTIWLTETDMHQKTFTTKEELINSL